MLKRRVVPPCSTRVSSFVPKIPKQLTKIGTTLLLLAIWPNLGRAQGAVPANVVSFKASRDLSISARIFGDFNGDGKVDFVSVRNTGNCIMLSINLNRGDGTFAPPKDVDCEPGFPTGMAVGDFNGDGRLDLAVSDFDGYHVTVLLGNGDGTFRQQPGGFSMGCCLEPFGPSTLAVGDFNGDGRLDLMVADESSGVYWLAFGNGDGTFQPIVNTGLQTVGVVGDFNGDGKSDIAYANGTTVAVALSNGDGTFQAPIISPGYPSSLDSRTRVGALAAADLNKDGRLDLVAVNRSGNGDAPLNDTVSVLLGNGDGSFRSPQLVTVGKLPVPLAVADVNGDGVPDIITGTEFGALWNDFAMCCDTISIALGKGDGTFEAPQDISIGIDTPSSILVSDFNGDGRPDLVVGDDNLFGGPGFFSVFLGNGNGTFQSAANYSVGSDPRSVAIGDFNGDGRPDLAVSSISGSVSVLIGNADGTFQPAVDYAAGVATSSVAAGDFNGDGIQDLVVTNSNSNPVSIMFGNGDGTFQAARAISQVAFRVLVGDFNGDGRSDLVASGANGTFILLSNGDGTFTTGQNLAAGSPLVVADFNGDGRLDLVTNPAGAGNPVLIFLGNGDGTFQPGQAVTGQQGGSAAVAGDFNGDGHLDLAAISNLGISVSLGNGDGTFQPPITSSAQGGDFGEPLLVVGDFNADGKLDLAIAGADAGILLGNGDGSFQPQQNFGADWQPFALAAADFNGDGLLDLAVVNKGSNDVSILINNTSTGSSGNGSPIPLAISANNASRVYGDPDPPFTVTYSGFANGDSPSSLSGSLVCESTATASSRAGAYAILCSGLSSQRYAISYVSGVLGVAPAPLTIRANSASRPYGTSNPAFTGTLIGVKNGDNIAVTYSSTATSSSSASTYLIVPALVDPHWLANYDVRFVNGFLTVTPAPLMVAASNATSILHGSLPSFSASYSGFVNGDGPSSLSGALNCTTNATGASPVGSYVINCSGQSSNNYSIAYKSGTLSLIYQPGGMCVGQPGHAILPPIDASGSSVMKQGRTVPAQFRVCDANGVSIGTTGVVTGFYLTQISNGTSSSSVDEAVASTTPDTAFRWDSTGQQWIFNVSTSHLSAGQTYGFTIALNDGSKISFGFGLR